jgi:hypothetical protein
VKESESVSVWQSLSFRPNYKAAYCMAVCPAGEDVIGPYLASKKDFADNVMRPLQAKREPVYVVRGSDAEAHVQKRYPHKTVRQVRGSLRPRRIASLLFWMPLSFQRHASGKLDVTYHFVFTGNEPAEAAVTIPGRKNNRREWPAWKTKHQGHGRFGNVAGISCGRAESFVGVAHAPRLLQGNPKWLLALKRCFPSNFTPTDL